MLHNEERNTQCKRRERERRGGGRREFTVITCIQEVIRDYTSNNYYHKDNVMKNGREGIHSNHMYSRGH